MGFLRMNRLTTLVLILFSAILQSCVSTPYPYRDVPIPTTVQGQNPVTRTAGTAQMTLSEPQKDQWLLKVKLEKPQKDLFWRMGSFAARSKHWELITPGRFIHQDNRNRLEFDQAVSEFTIKITPNTEDRFLSDHPFFRVGSDGALFKINTFGLYAARTNNYEPFPGPEIKTDLKIVTEKPIHIDRNVQTPDTFIPLHKDQEFLFIGSNPLTDSENFYGAIDTRIPAWLEAGFDDLVGQVVQTQSEMFGREKIKPFLFLYTDAQSTDGWSANGVALSPDFSVFKVKGGTLQQYSRSLDNFFKALMAHEIAHLFQNNIYYRHGDQDWIKEGSAELMALKTIAKAGLVDDDYLLESLSKDYHGCRAYLSGRAQNNLHRSYDCGRIIAMAADAILEEDDIFSFWLKLSDEARQQRAKYNDTLYLQSLKKYGADDDVLEALTRLIHYVDTDPASWSGDQSGILEELLAKTGLSAVFHGKDSADRFKQTLNLK